MEKIIVYIDVLGYKNILERSRSTDLIKKFYKIVENVAPNNILIEYSDFSQLAFGIEKLGDALSTTGKIFKKLCQYNVENCKKNDFDSMIFLSGGISIDKDFQCINVKASLNKKSYAGQGLASAYELSNARRGAVMFISEEVFKEYDNNKNLKKRFYCYERKKYEGKKDEKVKADFGWMYDDNLEKIVKVIRLAEKMCEHHRPPTPPPFEHPELNPDVRIYQHYEEMLKLALRCLSHYIRNHSDNQRTKAKEILEEFLDYKFSDVSMHPYNWGIWLVAFQAYFISIDSPNELSVNDKKLLKQRFMLINHSNKMDDFYREWRQNPEFYELDEKIYWLDLYNC